MDSVDLAVGIAGLCGLFSTCLEGLEAIASYRAYSSDSQALETQFRAQKLRLQKWGQAVGFDHGELLDDHHPAIDDAETRAMVEDLLQIINSFCQSNHAVPKRLARVGSGFKQREPAINSGQPAAATKRQRAVWALWGKGKREDDIKLVSDLIQQLHNLVPPTPIKERQSTRSHSHQIHEDESESQTSILAEVKQFLSKRERERQAELRRDLQSWISGDNSPNNIFDDATQKRLDGTCEWILRNQQFLDWLDEDSSPPPSKLFWVHGPAGFGKTILFARVVEYLTEIRKPPVAYFFFSSDFESRQDYLAAARSWLCQMIRRETLVFEIVYDEWLAHDDPVASQSILEKLFIGALRSVPGCILALDGVDECTSIEKVIALLAQVVEESETRVLVVSRADPEIREALEDHTDADFIEYSISVEDVRADTAIYSRDIVNKKLSNKKEDIKDDISRRIADRCDGQFLWVKMQADSLRKGMNQLQLQRKISETPTELARMYERNWDSIMKKEETDRLRAFTLLRWAAFSYRPLTVSEITEAALIEDDGNYIAVEELPDELDIYYVNSEILGLCDSLIEVRGNKEKVAIMTVHVAHFSVKQFLLLKLTGLADLKGVNDTLNASYQTIQNAMLAKKCIQYISSARVWSKDLGPFPLTLGVSFRRYAATWFRHANLVSHDDPNMQKIINAFFDSKDGTWESWRRWYDIHFAKSQVDEDVEPNPLFYASALMLADTVKHLLNRPNCDINRGGGQDMITPLAVACANGDGEIVNILLDAGASLLIEDRMKRTPFHLSIQGGNISIVNVLLEKGADPNCIDEIGITPLHVAALHGDSKMAEHLLANGSKPIATKQGTPLTYASELGHLEIAKLFLEIGVDVESLDMLGRSALNIAAQEGRLEIIKLLLVNGSNVNSANHRGLTPLHMAVFGGYLELVELLLEKGADIEITDQRLFAPLHIATNKGNVEIVKLLLGNGAKVNIRDVNGWTPLNSAVESGCFKAVELLLEKEANLEIETTTGWTPLHRAAYSGHFDIAKLLLEHGSNIDAKSYRYLYPIHLAAIKGHVEILKLLLEYGCETQPKDDKGSAPLSHAAFGGHYGVVKVLLENGSDIEMQDNQGSTPLNSAAESGGLEVIKLLLKEGANVMTKNHNKRSPLFNASKRGHVDAVELLLQEGSDIEDKDCDGITPLIAAAGAGELGVVKLLLEKGSDIEATDDYGYTPLFDASANGHLQVTQLLLQHGSDIKTKNNEGSTPLWIASEHGHLKLVKLLLQHGSDINIKGNNGATPLLIASENGHFEVVRFLLQQRLDIDVRNDDGTTPLLIASQNGHLKLVELLLQHGSDINIRDNDGATPLLVASENGHFEVIKLLLQKGSDINVKDNDGDTPLLIASGNGHFEVVKYLLQQGSDIDTKNDSGTTPLLTASVNGHIEIVEFLLHQGLSIETEDDYGSTPLTAASESGNLELVELLLEKISKTSTEECEAQGSCNVVLDKHNQHGMVKRIPEKVPQPRSHLADWCGRTPLFFAAMYGYADIVRLFLERSTCSIDATDWYGSSPFLVTVKHGHVGVVQQLLDFHDIDLNAKDKSGHNPIWWARTQGHAQIVELLLRQAEKKGICIDDTEPIHSCSPPPLEQWDGYCDVCVLFVPINCTHYTCEDCSKELLICLMCYEAGGRCPKTSDSGKTHKMVLD